MKKQKIIISILLTTVISLAVIIGGSYALSELRNKPKESPEKVVLNFYREWVEYEGNPMVDKIYKDNSLVRAEFSEEIDRIISSFDKGGYDPILCAQDKPESATIKNISVDNDNASVILLQDFSSQQKNIQVNLIKENNQWQISEVICQEGEIKQDLNSGVSPAIQNLVGDYIKENISDLSPEPAVLGGTYYVTSVRFIGPYSAVVDYEDGHIIKKAKIEFEVPRNKEVNIKSFEILPEEQNNNKINFQKSGNIVKRDGGWKLVYEEPGKPALTVDLVFSEDIKETWKNGDRVEVQGTKNNGSIFVVSISGQDYILCEDNCGNGICEEIVCLGQGCPCAETVANCPIDCN